MSFVKIRYKRMCLFRYILVCRLDSFVSAFSLLSNHDFGVIQPPSGQGALWDKRQFVGQRHTLL